MMLTLAILVTLWVLFTPKVTRDKEKRTETWTWQAHKTYFALMVWLAYIFL
jgi:hypothetical protein